MSISNVLFRSCNRMCSASASRFLCRNWSLSASNARFLSRNSSPSSLEAFRRSSNSVSTSDRVLWRGRVWFAGSSGTPHAFRYSVATPTFFNHSSFCSMPRLINNFNQFSGYRIIERMRLLQPSLHGTDQNPLKTTRTRSRQQPIKSFECTMLCFTKTVSSINYYSHSPSNHTLTIPFSVPSSHNRRLWRVPLPPYPWSCVLRRVNSRSIHCKSALQCQQSEPSHQTCAPFE